MENGNQDVGNYGAIQKLRDGQRGGGLEYFVAYRYVYFQGEGVFYEIVA